MVTQELLQNRWLFDESSPQLLYIHSLIQLEVVEKKHYDSTLT